MTEQSSLEKLLKNSHASRYYYNGNARICLILWTVDPLLDNDSEINNYTTAVAKKWFCKQWPLVRNGSVAIT
jgi:hypothetical protein